VRIGDSRGRLGGYGTGFLVSPRLLLTNNHVLRNAAEAGNSQIEFNYQSSVDGAAQGGFRLLLPHRGGVVHRHGGQHVAPWICHRLQASQSHASSHPRAELRSGGR
jgi:hypothetical protein